MSESKQGAPQSRAVLLAYSEPGPNVPEAEFNDWYDNEHLPAYQKLPTWTSAKRLKATDGKSPSYIAIYELDDIAILSSKEFEEVRLNASDREKAILAKLELLKPELWQFVQAFNKAGEGNSQYESRATKLLLVEIRAKREQEINLDKWYQETYFPTLFEVPGFLWGRTFKRVISPGEVNEDALEYLELVEWEDTADVAAATVITTLETGECFKVISQLEHRETRIFGLHKRF